MNKQPAYEINMELGECYLFSGDFEQSEKHYLRAAQRESRSPEPYLGLATVAVQRGDLDKALDSYEHALENGAGDTALAGMGMVKMEQGQHEEALDSFAAAAIRNPRNPVAVNGLLREAVRLNRVDFIVDILWRCLVANPEKCVIRTSIAETLMDLGHTDAAHALIEAVLQENPSDSVAKELHRLINAA